MTTIELFGHVNQSGELEIEPPRQRVQMAIRQVTAYDEFIEFMAALPSLDEIANHNMSQDAQARIRELLDANRNRRLTDAENAELDEYEHLGRLVKRANIRAFEKIDDLNQNTTQKSQ